MSVPPATGPTARGDSGGAKPPGGELPTATVVVASPGLPAKSIESTEDPAEAVRLVQARLRAEDVVLVKGSRGMKMERISDQLAGTAAPQGAH